MQRLFFLALAFVISLGAAIGIFLYVSLVPYFSVIGKFAAGLLIFCLICVACLAGTFTYAHMGIMLAKRRQARNNQYMLAYGEVVAYFPPGGNLIHLSAMHEAAKIPPQVVNALPLPEPETDKETILELYDKGLSIRDISKTLGITYYQVQKVTSAKQA